MVLTWIKISSISCSNGKTSLVEWLYYHWNGTLNSEVTILVYQFLGDSQKDSHGNMTKRIKGLTHLNPSNRCGNIIFDFPILSTAMKVDWNQLLKPMHNRWRMVIGELCLSLSFLLRCSLKVLIYSYFQAQSWC